MKKLSTERLGIFSKNPQLWSNRGKEFEPREDGCKAFEHYVTRPRTQRSFQKKKKIERGQGVSVDAGPCRGPRGLSKWKPLHGHRNHT